MDSTRSAVFSYDLLNRITQAETVNTTSGNCWGEAYTIDAWGNLTNRSGVSGMSGNCHTEPLNAAPASVANQLNGNCHDAAGNLVLDQTCPSGSFTPTYYYNSENQLYNPNATYTYTYDADGVRAQKAASATVGTKYWPGPGGEFLMETNGSGTISEEYIYFDGERIARVDRLSGGSVHYYFADKLGSASVITSSSGSVQEQYFYYPYGGLVASIGSDTNHYLFTGKERDTETGNDYFGARYYGSGLGRFLTPDWAARPVTVPYANFGNPQSLNLYTYVENNPTTLGDPNGHDLVVDPALQSVVDELADESPSVYNELQAHAGPDNPDLVIEPGRTPDDVDGSPSTGDTNVRYKTYPGEIVPYITLGDYDGAIITISDSIMKDSDKVKDVIKHELGHDYDARFNTSQFYWDIENTKEHHGQIPGVCKTNCHDKRPEEIRANDFKARVDREIRGHRGGRKQHGHTQNGLPPDRIIPRPRPDLNGENVAGYY